MDDYFEYLYDLIIKHELSDEEVEYSQSLYRKLINREYMENGRSTTKEGILENLLETVEKFDIDTIEGALASVFIYHQIAEEWLFDLLELTRFYIDLKLYPDQITHKPAEGLKLHALISEIDNSIDFEYKEDLIKYGRLVNNKRNEIAHTLLKKNSLEEIKIETDEFERHFYNLFQALEGDGEKSYGAIESLLEMIKSFHKWSDEFYDKHRFLLTEILEMNDIDFLEEANFENKT
jgi:hypothetical protein